MEGGKIMETDEEYINTVIKKATWEPLTISSAIRGGTDAWNGIEAHFLVKHLKIAGVFEVIERSCTKVEWVLGRMCLCFHTLTFLPEPPGGFFPEPSSSPSTPSPSPPGNLERSRCPWARKAGGKQPAPHSTTKYGHKGSKDCLKKGREGGWNGMHNLASVKQENAV